MWKELLLLSLDRVLDFVEGLLAAEKPLAGPILRGLTHATLKPRRCFFKECI